MPVAFLPPMPSQFTLGRVVVSVQMGEVRPREVKDVFIAFVIDGGHEMRCKARFISQIAHCQDVLLSFYKHVLIDSRDGDL